MEKKKFMVPVVAALVAGIAAVVGFIIHKVRRV
jgi:hypothetical protein